MCACLLWKSRATRYDVTTIMQSTRRTGLLLIAFLLLALTLIRYWHAIHLELALNVDGPPGRVTSGEPVLVAIVGPIPAGKPRCLWRWPTGSAAKSSIAIRWRCMREFDIGTAKPTAGPPQAPHHLFDCVAPTEYITGRGVRPPGTPGTRRDRRAG